MQLVLSSDHRRALDVTYSQDNSSGTCIQLSRVAGVDGDAVEGAEGDLVRLGQHFTLRDESGEVCIDDGAEYSSSTCSTDLQSWSTILYIRPADGSAIVQYNQACEIFAHQPGGAGGGLRRVFLHPGRSEASRGSSSTVFHTTAMANARCEHMLHLEHEHMLDDDGARWRGLPADEYPASLSSPKLASIEEHNAPAGFAVVDIGNTPSSPNARRTIADTGTQQRAAAAAPSRQQQHLQVQKMESNRASSSRVDELPATGGQTDSVAEALSAGVAWDELGSLKIEARQLKWNKSKWSRTLLQTAGANKVPREVTHVVTVL